MVIINSDLQSILSFLVILINTFILNLIAFVSVAIVWQRLKKIWTR